MAIPGRSVTPWDVTLVIAVEDRWAMVPVVAVGLGRACPRGRNVPRDPPAGLNGKEDRDDMALYLNFDLVGL